MRVLYKHVNAAGVEQINEHTSAPPGIVTIPGQSAKDQTIAQMTATQPNN